MEEIGDLHLIQKFDMGRVSHLGENSRYVDFKWGQRVVLGKLNVRR